MNIYEKLALARNTLQEKGMKKTGENKFAGYSYFELGDFLPEIVKQEGLLKFCCVISFEDRARLTITDTEKPEDKIIFESPMSTAALKGMHEVQNLGAVQTYIRRYLYTNAFEIVESDAIDASKPEEKQETRRPDAKVTSDQLEELKKLCLTDGKPDQTKIGKLHGIYTNEPYKCKTSKDILAKDFMEIKNKLIGRSGYDDTDLPFPLE